MVAFDMDAAVNDNVRKAKDRATAAGGDAGFDMTPMTWNPQYKGIDDLLFAVKKKRLSILEERNEY